MINDLPSKKRTSKLAIASMALGIVCLVFLSIAVIDLIDWDFFRSSRFRWFQDIHETLGAWNILFGAVPVISALLLGWISIVRINNANNLKGKPLAFFGIASSSALILFFLYIIIAFLFSGFR
jgi:hypothetical protein